MLESRQQPSHSRVFQNITVRLDKYDNKLGKYDSKLHKYDCKLDKAQSALDSKLSSHHTELMKRLENEKCERQRERESYEARLSDLESGKQNREVPAA